MTDRDEILACLAPKEKGVRTKARRLHSPKAGGPYVKIRVAAPYLDIAEGSFRNKLSRGEFPPGISVKIGGARRIHLPTLMKYLEDLRLKP